jgi:hypothetical protein
MVEQLDEITVVWKVYCLADRIEGWTVSRAIGNFVDCTDG